MLIFSLLFGIAGAWFPCTPILSGEYRGFLSDTHSLVIRPEISKMRMVIETDSGHVDLIEDFFYEFDEDCRVVAADRFSRDGFNRIRTRVYEITRKLVVEDIEYRVGHFFIGGWLNVVRTGHLLPGSYRLGSRGILGAGLVIEDDAKLIFTVPIDGDTLRVKASFKVTGPGRAWITVQRDDQVWDQILLARQTFKWILLNEFETIFVGTRIQIEGDVFVL
jgi:hypothetical protein